MSSKIDAMLLMVQTETIIHVYAVIANLLQKEVLNQQRMSQKIKVGNDQELVQSDPKSKILRCKTTKTTYRD